MRLLYALPCQLKAQAGTTLGFGKNRLVVEFSGPATFAPIDVELQSLARTRHGTGHAEPFDEESADRSGDVSA